MVGLCLGSLALLAGMLD